jgi:hypothetical protein
MYRAYLGPSSGSTTVCVQQLILSLLLLFLDDCLLSWLDSKTRLYRDVRLTKHII